MKKEAVQQGLECIEALYKLKAVRGKNVDLLRMLHGSLLQEEAILKQRQARMYATNQSNYAKYLKQRKF